MRALSATLSDMIVLAEEMTTRPTTGAGPIVRERIHSLHSEVKHAVQLPAEVPRTTSAAVVMITSLREYSYRRDLGTNVDLGSLWLMLAGATLPLLRAEAHQALLNEREQ